MHKIQVTPQPSRFNHLFEYTSGRWLYNERKRLEERARPFDVSELKNLAAKAVSKTYEDVVHLQKLGEGACNRAFIIRMQDGSSLVARIPYSITVPKGAVVASEVATMSFLRSRGMPVPNVYGYSASTDNPAGVEYILMENSPGRILSSIWDEMNLQDQLRIVSNIVEVENRLFRIRLPASGSIYFLKDLPQGVRGVPIDDQDADRPFSFQIGPSTSTPLWFGRRGELWVDRGPFTECSALLTAGAKKESEYLTQFGRPLLPSSRMRRETFNLERQDPGIHVKSLESYIQIAEHLIPSERPELLQPIIRHPDLRPSNIFVSNDFGIASLIDWQHSTVQPLFTQAELPSMFNNSHDPASRSLETPRLPGDFDDMSEEEKVEQTKVFRNRRLHYDYISQTARNNGVHFEALNYPYASLRRRLHRLSSDQWQGDNVPLRSSLIAATQQWSQITSNPQVDCPVAFPADEQQEYLSLEKLVREAEDEMHAINAMLDIGPDGWVPCDRYDFIKAAVKQMKADCLERAESEMDKAAVRDHWVFDDMDEDEYR